MVEAANGSIVEAVVSVHQSMPGVPEMLIAHVVFDPNVPKDEQDRLISSLRSRLMLPQYMCPAAILSLDQMPTTSSGKLDRRTIANLSIPRSRTSQQEPKLTDVERQLREIWTKVVPDDIAALESITSETDFFHVGGTSLLLLSLQARIETLFGIRLPVIQMFEASTLGNMAIRIENKMELPVETFNWDDETKLSPATLKLGMHREPPVPQGS